MVANVVVVPKPFSYCTKMVFAEADDVSNSEAHLIDAETSNMSIMLDYAFDTLTSHRGLVQSSSHVYNVDIVNFDVTTISLHVLHNVHNCIYFTFLDAQ